MSKQKFDQDAFNMLNELVKPGDTIYTAVRHVSQSGMTRHISLFIPIKARDGNLGIRNISHLAARVLGWPMNKNGDAVKVGGCGMDMGFNTVYELSATLYKDEPDRGKAGYILHQSWI